MTLPSADGTDPLRVVLVGAGAMGRHWVQMLTQQPEAELVGVVDLNVPLAESVVAGEGLSSIAVGADLAEVIRRSDATAIVNVTVPQAHAVVNEVALRAGLPVLCEKPLAPTLSAALRQVALADVTGQLLTVSQSRRYFNKLRAMRDARRLAGPVAAVTHSFYHADHEPGFREVMAHPLLIDMSIHHFDALRFLTDDDPVSARCTTSNPSWSWFAGDAVASAMFQLESGALYTYSGSRCTPGLQTSWNGDWSVYTERGALHWDGDDALTVDVPDVKATESPGREQTAGAFLDFFEAVRSGRTPQNEVRSNVLSLAMVEAAIVSSGRGGATVTIDELLDSAYRIALKEETSADVAEQLRSWGSVRAGISSHHWGTNEPTEKEATA